ncbi:MAG TPA: hypothetical protein VHR55_03295 [Candidatus Limnocylindria bacterium]|nr:hypothetical protein [Candidatus Limnocylindria bacterium]
MGGPITDIRDIVSTHREAGEGHRCRCVEQIGKIMDVFYPEDVEFAFVDDDDVTEDDSNGGSVEWGAPSGRTAEGPVGEPVGTEELIDVVYYASTERPNIVADWGVWPYTPESFDKIQRWTSIPADAARATLDAGAEIRTPLFRFRPRRAGISEQPERSVEGPRTAAGRQMEAMLDFVPEAGHLIVAIEDQMRRQVLTETSPQGHGSGS